MDRLQRLRIEFLIEKAQYKKDQWKHLGVDTSIKSLDWNWELANMITDKNDPRRIREKK